MSISDITLLGVSPAELGFLALVIVLGGVVTGILAGLFGIGGGGVIVPVLYEVFRVMNVPEDIRMQLCIGTSLAIIVPTTLRSYAVHRAKNAVMTDVVRKWVIPTICGVVVGSLTAAFAPSWVFRLAFSVIISFVACKLLFGRESWRLGHDLPGQPLMSIYGVVIGLCSTLMGISGGAITNLVMSLYGKTIHQSVATSSGVGVPLTIAGTIGYMLAGLPHQAQLPPLSIGFVSLLGFALMAPVSSYMASHGARLAHWMPKRKLEIAFGIFLLTVAMRFVASLIF